MRETVVNQLNDVGEGDRPGALGALDLHGAAFVGGARNIAVVARARLATVQTTRTCPRILIVSRGSSTLRDVQTSRLLKIFNAGGFRPFIGLTFIFFALFPLALAIAPDGSGVVVAFVVLGAPGNWWTRSEGPDRVIAAGNDPR